MREIKKVKLKTWHVLLLFVIIILAVFLKSWEFFNLKNARFEFSNESYKVLLANTPEKAYKGLSFREDLGDYSGMLFIFNSPAYYVMVMRNMNFPIDIVWLNNGVVVDIAPRAQPEPGVEERLLKEYRPRLPANVVLELKAGFTEEKGVKIGDKIEIFK